VAWRRRAASGMAGVQVSPRPLRRVVVQRAIPAALRALPDRLLVMRQVHVHLSVLLLQINTLYKPRRLNAQNLFVQLAVLHGEILPRCMNLPTLTACSSVVRFLFWTLPGETELGSAGEQPDKG
jgi:hypothetical protein